MTATRELRPSIDATLRAPYVRPVLRVYGSVSALTLGPGGTIADSTIGTKKLSDRTLKQDIVQVGMHSPGIGLYLFDYKPAYRDAWGHDRQLGVMADEVEAIAPEAVSLHEDGYKVVDYARLPTAPTPS